MNYHKRNTNKNYDWNKLDKPLVYKNEIAEFINDIGKGVKMTYGTEKSEASDENAKEYFKCSGYPNTFKTDYDYNFLKKNIDNHILSIYLLIEVGEGFI